MRFLWALRKAGGGGGAKLLPAGFERRIHRRARGGACWVDATGAGAGARRSGMDDEDRKEVRVLAHAVVGWMTRTGKKSLMASPLDSTFI